MILDWIEQTITALEAAGLPAQRGYPSGLMPSLSEPMATISIRKAEEQSLILTVQIYAPVEQGGTICEDLALTAATALRPLGAECRLGGCSFSGKGGLFTLPLTAIFTQETVAAAQTEDLPKVELEGRELSDLTDVSVTYAGSTVKVKDTTTSAIEMASAEGRWYVTVEERMDIKMSPVETIVDGFTITIVRTNYKEVYKGCCWEKITMETQDGQTRRVRVAITCNAPTVQAV